MADQTKRIIYKQENGRVAIIVPGKMNRELLMR